jgi:hypothetical protein
MSDLGCLPYQQVKRSHVTTTTFNSVIEQKKKGRDSDSMADWPSALRRLRPQIGKTKANKVRTFWNTLRSSTPHRPSLSDSILSPSS